MTTSEANGFGAHSPGEVRTLDGPQTMPTDQAGWWEMERALLVRQRLSAIDSNPARVADIGCGRGTVLPTDGSAGHMMVFVDSYIWDEWTDANAHYVCASADTLPFRDGAFDIVGSFDVLEHLPFDHDALDEQRRITVHGGAVVAAVPADPRLWSAHDLAVGHERRYTQATFRSLAESVGLTLDRQTYFYSYLWLPAWAMRNRPLRQAERGRLGDRPWDGLLQAAIHLLSAAERRIIRNGRLPFGTSLWVEMRNGRRTH